MRDRLKNPGKPSSNRGYDPAGGGSNPSEGGYSAPDPLAGGEGARCPSTKNPPPLDLDLRPSNLVSSRLAPNPIETRSSAVAERSCNCVCR